jgi:hypothetical protein
MRLALTLMTLVFSETIFIAILSVRASMLPTLGVEQTAEQALAVPGVVNTEVFGHNKVA